MSERPRWYLPHPDPILLLVIVLFALIGMVTLYSAVHQGSHAIWWRQLQFWGIGLSVMMACTLLPLRVLGLLTWPLFVVSLLLLALVPLIGDVHMCARRWLLLGSLRLQPSELIKWSLMLLLVHWFSSRSADHWRTLLPALLACLIPVLLIVKQPDLGTALIILMESTALVIVSGFPWRWLIAAALSSPIFMALLWHSMHHYQKNRVLTFLNPNSDPLGAGYHVIQSVIAIGSGGLLGKGLLHGTQDRLHFLPEQHTDFIFSVLAEEGGLLAASVLLLLFAMLIVRIFVIATAAHSRFGALFSLGVAAMFTIYTFVNIGMVSGLLPVVGVPLPFISYGGSALVTMLAAIGLVMRVAFESGGNIPWQRPGSPLA